MRHMILSVELKATVLLVNAQPCKGKFFIFSRPCSSKPSENPKSNINIMMQHKSIGIAMEVTKMRGYVIH